MAPQLNPEARGGINMPFILGVGILLGAGGTVAAYVGWQNADSVKFDPLQPVEPPPVSFLLADPAAAGSNEPPFLTETVQQKMTLAEAFARADRFALATGLPFANPEMCLREAQDRATALNLDWAIAATENTKLSPTEIELNEGDFIIYESSEACFADTSASGTNGESAPKAAIFPPEPAKAVPQLTDGRFLSNVGTAPETAKRMIDSFMKSKGVSPQRAPACLGDTVLSPLNKNTLLDGILGPGETIRLAKSCTDAINKIKFWGEVIKWTSIPGAALLIAGVIWLRNKAKAWGIKGSYQPSTITPNPLEHN